MAEKPSLPAKPDYTNSDLDKVQPSDVHKFWAAEIERSRKYFNPWWEVCDRILERYRDERGRNESESRRTSEGGRVQTKRFNILWSNVQTLFPALYSGVPDPVVSKRYKDDDPMARLSVEILERCLNYMMDPAEDVATFDTAARYSLLSRLLGGRGTPWITYLREVEEVEIEAVTAVDPKSGEEIEIEAAQKETRVLDERIVYDNVQYRDFLHSSAPTWDQILKRGWVAKRDYMTRSEVKEEFGEDAGKKIRLTATDTTDSLGGRYPRDSGETKTKDAQYAEVWEIWNRPNRSIYYYSPGYDEPLVKTDKEDKEDPAHEDPLNLRDFYPTPRPLYATMTEDRLIPVPDYHEYQDQAANLDSITDRKWKLTTALRVAGFYAGKEGEKLQQVFDGSNRNTLIPVQDWQDIMGDGGVNSASALIVWLPLDVIVQALSGLEQAEEDNKQQIYEITGIADIVRGQTKASETLGAQRLKGQWASVRISDKQAEMSKHLRDMMRITAEIIAEHFEPQTIARMSNFTNSKWMEAYGETFFAAIELLRDDKLRSYQIDVETADTVFADEMEEKRQNVEMITSMTQYLEAMVNIVTQAPETAPVMSEMLKIGLGNFSGSAARELDVAVDQMLAMIEEKVEKAKNTPPPPDPKMIEQQREAAKDMADVQDKQVGRKLEQQGQVLDFQKSTRDQALEKRGQDIQLIGMRRDRLADLLSQAARR